jgi:hypothetical protein
MAASAGESFGPVRKSYSGADRSHGTAASRGQTPEAAPSCPTGSFVLNEPREKKSRGGQLVKRHVGAKTPRGAITRKAEQNCEGNENPMSVAGN